MRLTTSRDYILPRRFSQTIGNVLLFMLPWVPMSESIEEWIHKRHSYYQVLEDKTAAHGSSRAKWEALQLPADLTGKSVLDVGCSEGFFCMESAKSGANAVLGIDSRLISLVCAKILALKHKADIKYQVAVFPNFRPSSSLITYCACPCPIILYPPKIYGKSCPTKTTPRINISWNNTCVIFTR
jgi:hypothetical protein